MVLYSQNVIWKSRPTQPLMESFYMALIIHKMSSIASVVKVGIWKGCWNSKRLFLGSKQSQELLFSTSSTISGIEDDYLNFIEHLPCDIELISLKKT